MVSVSSVCAADNNTGSLTTVKDNDSVYGCGVVAFQTALEYNDVNISLEEAEKATNTVNGSTSMQGLIDGAEKYNLSAVGASIKVEDLKTGYIVHMNIDNMGHWAVIEYLSDNVVLNNAYDYLIFSIDDFRQYYTNKTVIISKEPINSLNNFTLNSSECKNIIGNKVVKSLVGHEKKSGFRFTNHYGYRLSPKITPHGAKFSQWEYKPGTYVTFGYSHYNKPIYKYKAVPDGDKVTRTDHIPLKHKKPGKMLKKYHSKKKIKRHY